MRKNKKLSGALLKNLALSASAALGLALAPGCTVEVEGHGSEAVEFTLPSGESVFAVSWAQFKREHPTEAASEIGNSFAVNGGVLRHYKSLGQFVFLTAEEVQAEAELAPYGGNECIDCDNGCCSDGHGSNGCHPDGWCSCDWGGCSGRPFTVEGVARTANVEFGDGWATA